MKHILRAMMLVALMTGATSNIWADDLKVIINKVPADITGDNPQIVAGTVTHSISGRTVTLTVAPNPGYFVNKNTIKAEKMISAASAPRRADVIDNYLTINGDNEASNASPQNYTFDIPGGFTGANVTVTFYTKSTEVDYYISSLDEIKAKITENAANAEKSYELICDVSGSGFESITTEFTGTLDGGLHKITNLSNPLFKTVNGAKIRNIIIEGVNISGNGNVGAIACEAKGASRIYNCGILPTNTDRDIEGNITGFSGSYVGGTDYVGGLVGQLSNNSRVINCYSYATITGGNIVAGLVGYIGGTEITQDNLETVPMVVNCMFYGDITSGSTKYPVYGGKMIKTDRTNGVNPYNYFRANAIFDDSFSGIDNYNRSWPADEEYLTRFEYYRSILNSNKRLCTYWITDKVYGSATNAPTEADETLIAKWVLDPGIAPYPILKKWGKYSSIINPDPDRTWDSEANAWQSRSTAEPYRGKSFPTKLNVTVDPGDHAPNDVLSTSIQLTITDMDTLNYDYGYYKVQLPYYNEVFGNPTVQINAATDEGKKEQWNQRYGGNYKDYVVTGWKITDISGGVANVTNSTGTDANGVAFDHTFTANWESGYNYADRYCTTKDKYDKSTNPRVFAQGGLFYVPEGVTDITIEAYWGKAVYLHNTGHYIDRVNITNQTANGSRKLGNPFVSAGTLSTTFQGQDVYDDWQKAVKALDEAEESGSGDDAKLSLSVYDQAIVLLSNHQLRNENAAVGTNINDGKWYPYTMMSIDLDLDNEPDCCFEFQYRKEWNRDGIQPIRFDFLPVPELGLAVRHNANQNTIGIFVPQGHFEITETSFMHTTQFEYDGNKGGNTLTKVPGPIILNGGHFEQVIVRYPPYNNIQYFLMGGHFRMLRFTPGAHANDDAKTTVVRLCAVNCIGGEYPEFYLSGIYNTKVNPTLDVQGNPHCYTNGGRFGMIAGSGYEKVMGDVTFKVDHSIIDEFYGGGINGSKPVQGSIDVTIDHSIVTKFCGGPKVGVMNNGKTVTTYATGTTFTKYYGGGNGGTSYFREKKQDGNVAFTNPSTEAYWNNYGYNIFNPLNTIRNVTNAYQGTGDNKGYHALFEFECFVESNGIGANPTIRSYLNWAQFGKTSTGNITNYLDDCTIEENFYGGGNLGNVNGSVTSTLKDCTVKGNVFGGGYSGKIEPFRIHDKSKTKYPYIDKAGVMQDANGVFDYVKNTDGTDRYYTWCYRKSATEFFPKEVVIPSDASTNTNLKATFEYPEGSNKWYVLTTVSLEGLGAVSQYTSLTLKGNTKVGTDGDANTGNVYGGGNESAVNGNTTVNLEGNTEVKGSVFGGGNKAEVGGSAKVNVMYTEPTSTTTP